MIRYLILSILCILSDRALAQGGWVQLLDAGPRGLDRIYNIDYIDGYYYLLGDHVDSTFKSIKISKMDTLGQIVAQRKFYGNGDYVFQLNPNNNLTKIGQDSIFLCSDLPFSGEQIYTLIFDSLLDSIDYKAFPSHDPTDRNNEVQGSYFIDNKIIIGIENQRLDFLVDISMMSLDKSLNLNSFNYYLDNSPIDNYWYNLLNINEHKYGILSHEIEISIDPLEDVPNGLKLIIIDENFHPIDTIPLTDDRRNGQPSNLVHFTNEQGEDRFAFSCPEVIIDSFWMEFKYQQRYIVTDANGNMINKVQWGNTISRLNYMSENIFHNHHLYAAGQYVLDDSTARHPLVVKLNMQGDTLWTQTYDIYSPENQAESVEVTGMHILPSGSIFLVGNLVVYDFDWQSLKHPFVMKLDRHGCLEPGCRTMVNTEELIDIETIKLHPNPAQSHINVEMPAGEIAIYDINGTLRYQADTQGNTQIDISAYPAGIYIYTARVHGQLYSGKVVKL